MSTVPLTNRGSALGELVGLLSRHRDLTWEMTKREITDRYAGQVLGVLWAVGHPLFLMATYTFVFAYVLKLKLGGTVAMPLDYTVYLLSGLIPWMAFQEAMAKSSTVIVANANLVKQVVFPVEVLPIKGILAAMVTQGIASLLLLIYTLVSSGSLPWTWSLVPFLWLSQFLAMLGVCYMLSSAGAYFRDIKDFVQVFCTMGAYVLPAFYLPEWVPELVRPLLWLNPFSHMAWCYQDACYFGRIDHPISWFVFPLGSIAVCYAGYRMFRALKVCFGSVL